MANNRSIEDLKQQYGDRLTIAGDCRIDVDVRFILSTGSRLVIGEGTSILRGTTLEVLRGGVLFIAERVNIGENVYIAVMSSVVIGEGAAISNMVDIHDHNHKDRTYRNCEDKVARDDVNTSGFETAPIVIEPFATVSNKSSITAGVRIGQNSKIGANAVVTRSVPPNTIAVGVPARAIRRFEGPIKSINYPARLRVVFFGTSIMQHLEAFSPRIVDQMNLPQVGEAVEVTEWRTRGYVQLLATMLSVRWPHVHVEVINRGYGGANIRKLSEVIERFTEGSNRYDLAIFGCGINDVWRGFQGRLDDAVEPNEFRIAYERILTRLHKTSRRIICLSETPVNIDMAALMNEKLMEYNGIAARVAAESAVHMLDVWTPFKAAAELGQSTGAAPLWSDGIHLSERGDGLLFSLIEDYLCKSGAIEELLTLEPVDRAFALQMYQPLLDDIRAGEYPQC